MENVTLTRLFKKDSFILLAKIFVPGILFLAIMGVFSLLNDFHFSLLSKDPVQTLNGKPYVGIISNVGIIFWCASAAILLFSSILSDSQSRPKRLTKFLFFTGLLTLFMLIDDLFLMHDIIFPEYLHVGDIEFYLVYGSSVVAIIYFYRDIILNSDYILLIFSFILLAASSMIDMVIAAGVVIPYDVVVEDGLKFLGIITWFAYFTMTSYKNIKPGSPIK